MIGTVIKQIAWVRDPKPKKPTGKSPIPGGLGTVQSLPSNPRESRILIPAHQIVKVKPDLLGVIRSLEGVSQHKTIYTFPQVVSLIHKYIKSKRDELIDPRNFKVALVRNDPLGDVFHVQAFHLMQLNTFTVKQLFFTFPRRLKKGGNIRKSGRKGFTKRKGFRLFTKFEKKRNEKKRISTHPKQTAHLHISLCK